MSVLAIVVENGFVWVLAVVFSCLALVTWYFVAEVLTGRGGWAKDGEEPPAAPVGWAIGWSFLAALAISAAANGQALAFFEG